MLLRWLAAAPGAGAAALMIGVLIARSIEAAPPLAAASGGFMAVCAWALLAPLAIAQLSGRKACALMIGVFTSALLLAQLA